MKTYFNTTQLAGAELKSAIQRTGKQDDAIFLYYLHKREPFSPSQILAKMEQCGFRWPITSIRRSITTLCKAGHLVMTSNQVKGMYGDKEHQWQVNAIKYPYKVQGTQADLFDKKVA